MRTLRARAYDDLEVSVMLTKLLIGAGAALCVAACASNPPATTSATSKEATTANLRPAGCVGETATRLPLRPDECAAFGHIYTEKDLKSTGATDVGQALSVLDPSLTTTGPGRP